ncbi:MAG: DUF1329 domain-containing protein [Thermodesulfobacteriota bacterium]|nr:DUF1329 domain-containing protein [Thermodesulfobacteriota bacterium]
MKKNRWHVIGFGIVCVFSILLFYNITMAGDAIKAGDIIGPHNWEKARGYVPEDILKEIKEGYSFKVTSEPMVAGSPGHMKASRESRTKLTPDGGLEGYEGGIPFYPFNPKDKDAGIKAGWNIYRKYYGDDLIYGRLPNAEFITKEATDPDILNYPTGRRYCIDKYGHERISDIVVWEMQVAHSRVDSKLEPSLEKKLDDVNSYSSAMVTSPRDLAGTMTLSTRYWDPKKEDDFFIYIPSLRRVRRLPTTQRCATQTPADYTMDDRRGFSGKVPYFDWKITGEGKCLVGRASCVPTLHRNGKFLNVQKEWSLNDVYLLEHKPKDFYAKGYLVPKRVYWVDKNSFGLVYWSMYDKKGELWKNLGGAVVGVYRKGKGKAISHGITGLFCHDMQTNTATNVECHSSMNSGLDVGFFSLSSLVTTSRGQVR